MSPVALGPEVLQMLVQVAESLAFLMPLGTAECPAADAWGPVVRIAWNAPGKGVMGHLWLALTPDAAAETARNMCGLPMDEPVSTVDAGEAVGEMANVMIGNLLPVIHGATAEFHLGAPQTVPAGEFPSGIATTFDLGGGFLSVAIAEEEGEAP